MTLLQKISSIFKYKKSLIVLTVVCGLYYLSFALTHIRTEISPCGYYHLSVYHSPSFFAMPGDGSHGTKLVLRNKWGWTIGTSSEACSVFDYDIDIEWDYKNNQVWFATARTINLSTGACEM